MSDPLQAESIASLLKEHDRRLRALEQSPRAIATSINGGTFSVLDDNGVARVSLGITPSGGYGIEVRDANDVAAFSVDESGIDYPGVLLGWARPGEYSTTSSGSFITAYRSGFNRYDHDAFEVVVAAFSLDGSTVWQMQPQLYLDGVLQAAGPTRQETGGGSSVSTRYRLKWAPSGVTLGTVGRWTFNLAQRVVSGGGSVQMNAPEMVAFTSSYVTGATSGGSWATA